MVNNFAEIPADLDIEVEVITLDEQEEKQLLIFAR